MLRDVKSHGEWKMRCADVIGCNVRLCVSVYVRLLGASAASALRKKISYGDGGNRACVTCWTLLLLSHTNVRACMTC